MNIHSSSPLLSRTESMSSFIIDKEKQKLDEMLEMIYEIEDSAEKSVTMPDLLEGCLDLSGGQMEEFMAALASGSKEDLGHIYAVLLDVKASIVAERTKELFFNGE